MSFAQPQPSPFDNYRLFRKTTFGFSNILEWPAAIQRTSFFALAVFGEYLSATKLFGWIVNGLAQGVGALLTLLTPQAAADLENEPPRHGLRVLVLATLMAAFVISLMGNAVFTLLAGTFSGDEPHRYYYVKDSHNLVLYAFITPIYMSASAAIIYCALSSLSLTGRTIDQSNSAGRFWPVVRLGFVLAAIVLLAGLVQVNYFRDNIMGLARLEPGSHCFGRIFWFVDEISLSDGTKSLRLNSAGVYYLCMQFCHMAVIAAAVWFTITTMFTLYRLGLQITPEYLANNGGAEPVRAKLSRFTLLELSSKVLTLILTVHSQIWGDSCLRGSQNFRVTQMFLLALSVFVLATPRLLIEYRLLKIAAHEQPDADAAIVWPSLIDQRDRIKNTVVSGFHFLVQLVFVMLLTQIAVSLR